MLISKLPAYVIKFVRDNSPDNAYLTLVNESDILSLDSSFECNWKELWNQSDFNCEALVKLTYQGRIQGLIKFAFYPSPVTNEIYEFTEILNIESSSKKDRPVSPVGLWLIWYVVRVCLDFGVSGDEKGSILQLISLESAIQYYENKVMMERLGWFPFMQSQTSMEHRSNSINEIAYTESREDVIIICDRSSLTHQERQLFWKNAVFSKQKKSSNPSTSI